MRRIGPSFAIKVYMISTGEGDTFLPDLPGGVTMKDDPFSYQIFFEKVFNPIALYRVDGVGRGAPSADRVFYVDVNPAYERVTRVRKQDIVGRNFLDVWPEAEASASPLSDREQDVLRLLVKGLNAKQIAVRLGISKNTVDTHRRRIMDKVGCNSMAERTRYAIREGYLDLS